jgi:2-polyprenyl-3-methyl-5-hydroxy-6-metoxy-1,4-benzoquinol methylase
MPSKIKYDHCPGCGSAAISKALDCKDHTVSQAFFEVWKCTNCTLRFTQNVPGAAHIAPYYQSSAYVSHTDTKEGLINRLYHGVRQFTLIQKRGLVKNVTGTRHGILLDVGAGTGAFSHTMEQGGWSVTGLEPDSSARSTALAKYKLQLQTLEQLPDLSPASFDAITLWHVLEHVHDLHGYLHTFHRLLKPTGRLMIAVPNYTSHDAEVYKANWAAYDVPRHLYHFSPKSMQVLLSEKGFIVESMKPMWFDSFYISMLSEKYQSGSDNIAKAIWVGLVSNLKALFKTDKCSSVIYIIRKR